MIAMLARLLTLRPYFFLPTSHYCTIMPNVHLLSYFTGKEYKEEAQCAQKGGRMLVFVIFGSIKNFLPNSYSILQIYRAKSFVL